MNNVENLKTMQSVLKAELSARVAGLVDETADKFINLRDAEIYMENDAEGGINQIVGVGLNDEIKPVVFYEDERVETESGTFVDNLIFSAFSTDMQLEIAEAVEDAMKATGGYSDDMNVYTDGAFIEPMLIDGKYRWVVREFGFDGGVWADGNDVSVDIYSRIKERLITQYFDSDDDAEGES